MAADPRGQVPDAAEPSVPPAGSVTAHNTSPGRVVFTEVGNSDGWIATDLTVGPER